MTTHLLPHHRTRSLLTTLILYSLIRSGAAIPFTAHATPPTVTMPRVKALTTGSVPSFLDLILNFAESDTSSSLAAQDTWLAQIKARGGEVVFFGDDTWLKLFPDTATSAGGVEGSPEGSPGKPFFMRADGTSSFFVSVSRTGPDMRYPLIEQIAEYTTFRSSRTLRKLTTM